MYNCLAIAKIISLNPLGVHPQQVLTQPASLAGCSMARLLGRLWHCTHPWQVVARHTSSAGFGATIQEDFNDRIFALAEQFHFNTALSPQLPRLASLISL